MLASLWDVLIWVGAIIAVAVVILVGAVIMLGVSVFSGDGDISLFAEVVGLLLTLVALPILLFFGLPLCYLWPIRQNQSRSTIGQLRAKRMFTWWRWLFHEHNSSRAKP